MNNKIYCYEFSSQPNVDLIGITLYMCNQHVFETILNFDDVLNIQDYIGKIFGSRERSFSMVVNDYFGPRKTNRPHTTHNYGLGQSNVEIGYYRQTCFFPGKLAHIQGKLENQARK